MKQKHIVNTAKQYLAFNNIKNVEIDFDVIEISVPVPHKKNSVPHSSINHCIGKTDTAFHVVAVTHAVTAVTASHDGHEGNIQNTPDFCVACRNTRLDVSDRKAFIFCLVFVCRV